MLKFRLRCFYNLVAVMCRLLIKIFNCIFDQQKPLCFANMM